MTHFNFITHDGWETLWLISGNEAHFLQISLRYVPNTLWVLTGYANISQSADTSWLKNSPLYFQVTGACCGDTGQVSEKTKKKPSFAFLYSGHNTAFQTLRKSTNSFSHTVIFAIGFRAREEVSCLRSGELNSRGWESGRMTQISSPHCRCVRAARS